MDEKFQGQVDGLIEKYTELLLGEASEDLIEKVKVWALYTHIAKSMPALAKHWNETYPEAKVEMMKAIGGIKALNEQHRAQQSKN